MLILDTKILTDMNRTKRIVHYAISYSHINDDFELSFYCGKASIHPPRQNETIRLNNNSYIVTEVHYSVVPVLKSHHNYTHLTLVRVDDYIEDVIEHAAAE